MSSHKLDQYFADYSYYHQTSGNKKTHYVGIPLIVLSILGMFSFVQFNEQINLGILFWLGASIFYCSLDVKRGLIFSVINLGIYFLALQFNLQAHIAFFVIGWIFQGIGHYKYEKKSPAFIKNFSHLFIGPFWIFCKLWS